MHAENLQTTFIDHRQKGESLWLKKFEKNIGYKIKKSVLSLTEIKFRKLVSKSQKTPVWKESFSNVLGESNQLSKWNALACTCRNPTVLDSGPKLDLPFLFIQEWRSILNMPDFWFTFPYNPNVGPILDRFPGFWWIFPYPCVNATPLPTGLLERTRPYQYNIASMAVWRGLLYKICIWPIE